MKRRRKSRNLNELKRIQLPKAIKNKSIIYEIKTDNGLMFSLREPPDHKNIMDRLMIVVPHFENKSDLDSHVTSILKKYTTFLKDSEKIVYAKIRFNVYSEKHQREINKHIVFELGSWEKLYGTEEEPIAPAVLSARRIGDKIDHEESLNRRDVPEINLEIHPDYRIDKFIYNCF